MAAKKNEVQKLLDLAGEFVTKHGGDWGHDAWESFLGKAEKLGITVDDQGKRNLGNILEAAKFFYHKAGIVPPEKPAKKSAATKKKSAEKKTTAKKATAKKATK